MNQTQSINNINQEPTTLNNNVSVEPVMQSSNIFENQSLVNQPIENNIQPQIQSQPMITPNIQQTSNEIFPTQEQPQLNQMQQPINLESMPNPMNLEQIGVSTMQQQQVEEQNISIPKPSQYDSILSNNTDN